MGGLAILQALASLGQSTAKAKELRTADQIAAEERAQKARQAYSQLETAAVQRKHLRKIIEQMSANPEAKRIKDLEAAIGRPLTDIEKQRFEGIAPKETTGKVATKLVQDKNSSTGWSFISYDPISGQEYSRQLDAPPQRGLIAAETDTTDPVTGLVTKSVRKPIIGGTGTTAKPSPAGPLAKPSASKPASTTASLPPKAASAPAVGKRSVDADGHIPAADTKLMNPNVVETANELLDGKDMDKIKYPKLVPVAARLARQYGWEQGKFTPREQTMLREVISFIKRAQNDDSMSALDEGTFARLKLQQVAQNPDKQGFIGRGVSMLSATNMSDSQKKFMQTYNQLVGAISGMSQLVRSNRATEATIERLKAELPNPTTTRDSKDAHERLQRIMDEINIGLQKGTLGGGDTATDPHALIQQILRGGANASPD